MIHLNLLYLIGVVTLHNVILLLPRMKLFQRIKELFFRSQDSNDVADRFTVGDYSTEGVSIA